MSEPIHVHELPSGLTVALREFKVSDENLLANPKAAREGRAMSNLLDSITDKVEDPGLYQLSQPNKKHDEPWLDWSKVLQGDRMVALLCNRIETWGMELTTRLPCENNPKSCPSVVTDIDLSTLVIKSLPETSRKHVENPKDNPIIVMLPRCEKKIGFRLLRGDDERSLQKLQKQKADTISSSYLRFRTTVIEGIEDHRWNAWLEELGGADASFLRAAFDEHDCGVDQEVEFECDQCGHVWVDDVKFRSDFLFPKYRGTTSIKP